MWLIWRPQDQVNGWSFHTVSMTSLNIRAVSWQNQQPSEDSDQPWHPPSLIRVFAVRLKKVWVLSYPLSAERRLWSDWADAQADLSLRWAHMPLCWFCHEVAHYYKWLRVKETPQTRTSMINNKDVMLGHVMMSWEKGPPTPIPCTLVWYPCMEFKNTSNTNHLYWPRYS